jgi:hypothetical protein
MDDHRDWDYQDRLEQAEKDAKKVRRESLAFSCFVLLLIVVAASIAIRDFVNVGRQHHPAFASATMALEEAGYNSVLVADDHTQSSCWNAYAITGFSALRSLGEHTAYYQGVVCAYRDHTEIIVESSN